MKTTSNKLTGNKDTDQLILLNLDLESLSNMCKSSKFASIICKDKNFWRNKITKDFPLRGKFVWYTPYRDFYSNNPEKLYRSINQRSKIVKLNKTDYPTLAKTFSDEYKFGDMSRKDLPFITNEIIPNLSKLDLLRGDVIHFEWIRNNRNDGKLIWDGENVLELDYDTDEYGSVPKQFSFPEFPFKHFYDSIDHNFILWISPLAMEEIIRNFNEKTQKSFASDLYKKYPVVAGAKDEDEEAIHLTSEQFADYVKEHPLFDENIAHPTWTEQGVVVIGAYF